MFLLLQRLEGKKLWRAFSSSHSRLPCLLVKIHNSLAAYISRMLLAPSKAPSSIVSMLFRLRSRLWRFGRRLNRPRAGILDMSLSFRSSLETKIIKLKIFSSILSLFCGPLFFSMSLQWFECKFWLLVEMKWRFIQAFKLQQSSFIMSWTSWNS